MTEFKKEEIEYLHSCLKRLNIPVKLPPSEEMDYYVGILVEIFDRLNLHPRLAMYSYMAYSTLLEIEKEKEETEEMEKGLEQGE